MPRAPLAEPAPRRLAPARAEGGLRRRVVPSGGRRRCGLGGALYLHQRVSRLDREQVLRHALGMMRRSGDAAGLAWHGRPVNRRHLYPDKSKECARPTTEGLLPVPPA